MHRICSSGNDYAAKSIEYTKYLVNRGLDLKSLQQCFNNVGKISGQEARKKVKPKNAKTLIVFSTSFNPHGPNVNKIINRNIHLVLNNDDLKEPTPEGIISVANEKETNLQQLLIRSDPYNIKDDQQLKENRSYTKCSTKIVTPAITLLMKQLILNVMLLVENTK